MYDQKCLDLAESFLEDEPAIESRAEHDKHAALLAQVIQDAIENYIRFEIQKE